MDSTNTCARHVPESQLVVSCSGVCVCVCVCNRGDTFQDKCCRYWPAQGSGQYGCVEVTLLSQSTQPNYNKTRLQVLCALTLVPTSLECVCVCVQIRLVSGEEVRCVDHYRFTAWPQQGVPKDTSTVIEFLRCVCVCVCVCVCDCDSMHGVTVGRCR